MKITPNDLAPKERYALMTSVVVPRPIAWVTTKAASGQTNLAPFSYFSGLGSDPLMVTISISLRRGEGGLEPKDTLKNIQDTGAYCVHLVEEPLAATMDNSAAEYPPHVSEIEALGLATEPTAVIDGVRLRDARVAMECKVVDVHVYGRKKAFNLVVGEVVQVHVDDAILEPGPLAAGKPRVDPHLITPVARLGGPHYARLGERFKNQRKPVDG